jgi:hypothetical protein
MRKESLVSWVVAGLVSSGFAVTAQAADWLQFGYDQAHSGFNAAEFSYPVASQTTAQWSITLSDQSDAAPVYLSNVATANGTKDLIYVDTTNGTLIALDAANGAVVWSHQQPGTKTNEGQSGSPAIDPNGQFVYAYALDGKVHKYKVGDGTEITTGGWPQVSTVKPTAEKGASALAFSTPSGGPNYLYHVTNGYDGDGGDYQGHITTINLSSGAQNVFNVMCSNLLNKHFIDNGTAKVDDCNIGGGPSPGRAGQMSGIWGRPGAIYDTQTSRVLIATGNGLFDANVSGNFEWGDSVLSLKADGTGSGMGMPVDSYTPSNYAQLYMNDTDLGSTAPAILPSTSTSFPHLAIQSGKDACVRLINLDNMSGMGGPAHAGGELNMASSCDSSSTGDAIGGGVVFPQPAVWVNPADHSTWVYVVNYSSLQAYQLDVSGTPALTKKWSGIAGRSPVIADGVLYYVAGNAIVALDTVSGNQLWTAAIGAGHWQSPIIVNHHLYIADGTQTNGGKKLWAFTIDGVFRGKFE